MSNNAPANPTPRRGGNRLRVAILAVALLAIVAILLFLPVKDYFIRLLDLAEGLGFWGPVVVAFSYIIACVLFLPGSVLTLGAGFVFQVVLGTIVVSIGSTLGACTAFLVGRKIARPWIASKMASNDKFAAIDRAVGRQGFKIVLLVRLSPVFPFNMLNYAFGITQVSFWHYALASWIGMLPGTIMFVYFGAGLRSLADVAAGNVAAGAAQQIFFWVGLLATIVATVFVTRVASKALKEAIPQDEATTV